MTERPEVDGVNYVVQALEADLRNAVRDFAARPTNSRRMQFERDLRRIATALEVERVAGDFNADEQAKVAEAVDTLRAMADNVMSLDPHAVARIYGVPVPGAAKEPVQKAAPKATAREFRTLYWGMRILNRILRL